MYALEQPIIILWLAQLQTLVALHPLLIKALGKIPEAVAPHINLPRTCQGHSNIISREQMPVQFVLSDIGHRVLASYSMDMCEQVQRQC
jgi:hypothetical protein